jgi:hypothetical protein
MRTTPPMDALWQQAARYDRRLRLPRNAAQRQALLAALARKRIAAQPYSQAALFGAVAGSRPAVLQGVPVPVAGAERHGLVDALVAALERGFGDEPCARAQIGPQRVRRHLTVPQLMRRWDSGRHLVSVTDLHVRGTPLARSIDTRALSAFNLLPRGGETMQRQEMMTLVVASAGNVTDSHSDDPDGSNHCFVGRKLWLAWDTFEGRRVGLQDCEREPVNGSARFDLARFCALPGARWWTVESGQTLFLPGRFAHRVITLEPYIGIGSFYVTPASCLDSLMRWYVHGPLWSLDDPEGDNDGLVDGIARALQRRTKRLAHGSAAARRQWGLAHVALGLRRWRARWPAAQCARVAAQHPPLAGLVAALQQAAARA